MDKEKTLNYLKIIYKQTKGEYINSFYEEYDITECLKVLKELIEHIEKIEG